MFKGDTYERKPQRFEMTFHIMRRGKGEWAERTYRSYQKHPLTIGLTKEIMLAIHRMIGLFLRRHDEGFKWLETPVPDIDFEESETMVPSRAGPLSLLSVPRSRFIEATQTFEFIPGYTIELCFRSRHAQRKNHVVERKLKVNSTQTTPLTLFLSEDMLWKAAQAINHALDSKKRELLDHLQHNRGHDAPISEDDALELDFRISNNLGPLYSHVHRNIKSKLALFRDAEARDCESFLHDIEKDLVHIRNEADGKLNAMDDLELRIVELKGVDWSLREPAKFTLGPSASYGRRTIQAALDRIQTGVGDVIRGHNLAIHITAHKRGHLVLDKAIVAHEKRGKPREVFSSLEDAQATFVSRLKTRIQKDIDKVFEDSCSIDDIPEDEEDYFARPTTPAQQERPFTEEPPSPTYSPSSIRSSPARPSRIPIGKQCSQGSPRPRAQRVFSLSRRSTESVRSIDYLRPAPRDPFTDDSSRPSTSASERSFTMRSPMPEPRSPLMTGSEIMPPRRSFSLISRTSSAVHVSNASTLVEEQPLNGSSKADRKETGDFQDALGIRAPEPMTSADEVNPAAALPGTALVEVSRASIVASNPSPPKSPTPSLDDESNKAPPASRGIKLDKMDTPETFLDAREYVASPAPEQTLKSGSVSGVTSPRDDDEFSTAPATPELSVGGPSPGHSILLTPSYTRTDSGAKDPAFPEPELQVGSGAEQIPKNAQGGSVPVPSAQPTLNKHTLPETPANADRAVKIIDKALLGSTAPDPTDRAVSHRETPDTSSQPTALPQTPATARTLTQPASSESKSKIDALCPAPSSEGQNHVPILGADALLFAPLDAEPHAPDFPTREVRSTEQGNDEPGPSKGPGGGEHASVMHAPDSEVDAGPVDGIGFELAVKPELDVTEGKEVGAVAGAENKSVEDETGTDARGDASAMMSGGEPEAGFTIGEVVAEGVRQGTEEMAVKAGREETDGVKGPKSDSGPKEEKSEQHAGGESAVDGSGLLAEVQEKIQSLSEEVKSAAEGVQAAAEEVKIEDVGPVTEIQAAGSEDLGHGHQVQGVADEQKTQFAIEEVAAEEVGPAKTADGVQSSEDSIYGSEAVVNQPQESHPVNESPVDVGSAKEIEGVNSEDSIRVPTPATAADEQQAPRPASKEATSVDIVPAKRPEPVSASDGTDVRPPETAAEEASEENCSHGSGTEAPVQSENTVFEKAADVVDADRGASEKEAEIVGALGAVPEEVEVEPERQGDAERPAVRDTEALKNREVARAEGDVMMERAEPSVKHPKEEDAVPAVGQETVPKSEAAVPEHAEARPGLQAEQDIPTPTFIQPKEDPEVPQTNGRVVVETPENPVGHLWDGPTTEAAGEGVKPGVEATAPEDAETAPEQQPHNQVSKFLDSRPKEGRDAQPKIDATVAEPESHHVADGTPDQDVMLEAQGTAPGHAGPEPEQAKHVKVDDVAGRVPQAVVPEPRHVDPEPPAVSPSEQQVDGQALALADSEAKEDADLQAEDAIATNGVEPRVEHAEDDGSAGDSKEHAISELLEPRVDALVHEPTGTELERNAVSHDEAEASQVHDESDNAGTDVKQETAPDSTEGTESAADGETLPGIDGAEEFPALPEASKSENSAEHRANEKPVPASSLTDVTYAEALKEDLAKAAKEDVTATAQSPALELKSSQHGADEDKARKESVTKREVVNAADIPAHEPHVSPAPDASELESLGHDIVAGKANEAPIREANVAGAVEFPVVGHDVSEKAKKDRPSAPTLPDASYAEVLRQDLDEVAKERSITAPALVDQTEAESLPQGVDEAVEEFITETAVPGTTEALTTHLYIGADIKKETAAVPISTDAANGGARIHDIAKSSVMTELPVTGTDSADEETRKKSVRASLPTDATYTDAPTRDLVEGARERSIAEPIAVGAVETDAAEKGDHKEPKTEQSTAPTPENAGETSAKAWEHDATKTGKEAVAVPAVAEAVEPEHSKEVAFTEAREEPGTLRVPIESTYAEALKNDLDEVVEQSIAEPGVTEVVADGAPGTAAGEEHKKDVATAPVPMGAAETIEPQGSHAGDTDEESATAPAVADIEPGHSEGAANEETKEESSTALALSEAIYSKVPKQELDERTKEQSRAEPETTSTELRERGTAKEPEEPTTGSAVHGKETKEEVEEVTGDAELRTLAHASDKATGGLVTSQTMVTAPETELMKGILAEEEPVRQFAGAEVAGTEVAEPDMGDEGKEEPVTLQSVTNQVVTETLEQGVDEKAMESIKEPTVADTVETKAPEPHVDESLADHTGCLVAISDGAKSEVDSCAEAVTPRRTCGEGVSDEIAVKGEEAVKVSIAKSQVQEPERGQKEVSEMENSTQGLGDKVADEKTQPAEPEIVEEELARELDAQTNGVGEGYDGVGSELDPRASAASQHTANKPSGPEVEIHETEPLAADITDKPETKQDVFVKPEIPRPESRDKEVTQAPKLRSSDHELTSLPGRLNRLLPSLLLPNQDQYHRPHQNQK
ncbi:hypothetical protein VTI74DRAFT_11423 [Chaetomium olivicolor]